MPCDLFEKIFFNTHVHAKTRRFHRPTILKRRCAEAQALKNLLDNGIRDRRSKETLNTFAPEDNADGVPRRRISINSTAINLSACELLNHGGRAVT